MNLQGRGGSQKSKPPLRPLRNLQSSQSYRTLCKRDKHQMFHFCRDLFAGKLKRKKKVYGHSIALPKPIAIL